MFAAIVRKHVWAMLLAMGAALLAGGAICYFSRPVYYSRSLVRVGEDGSDERLRALSKELTQPQILERTANRLGVRATATELRKNFLFNIVVRPVSKRELEVEVWSCSKDWAERWTEALAIECVDFRRVRRRKEMLDAIKTLNKEMSEVAARIGDAGAKKFDAKDKDGLMRGLGELSEIRNSTRELARLAKRIEEMDRVRAGLQDAGISIVEKLSLIAAVDESAGRDGGDAAAPSAPPWESIEKRQRALNALIAGIPNISVADDAALLALGSQLDELDRKLQSELDANFRRFDVDYRNLVDRKASVEAKVAERNGQAGSAMNARLGHIAERIAAIDAIGKNDSLDPAFAGIQKISDRPVAPDPLKIGLLSLLGGGILAIGAPFLMERIGHRLPKIAQLESALRLRGLGTVPMLENLPPHTPPLADPSDSQRSRLAEDFRAIRDNLLAADAAGKPPQVIMVASAMPAEGKTIVAANLAMSFAETGARTLLIDTDLRRGRLHRLFGYRKTPGLSNVLLGELPLESAIRPTPHDDLFVLNSGKKVDEGSGLLASEKFADAMVALRANLEVIIVDTPPVLGLAETSVLQRHVDGVVLVISNDRTPKRVLTAAVEILKGRGANIRGFVLNRANPPAGR